MADYLVQEEDGTSKFTLEEAGGSLILEEDAGGAVGWGPLLDSGRSRLVVS